ncbi:MAG: hypothetical protein EOM54_10330 [Clostridia bacterium]|nr:hypothetical protein [Clostridia bacterium]
MSGTTSGNPGTDKEKGEKMKSEKLKEILGKQLELLAKDAEKSSDFNVHVEIAHAMVALSNSIARIGFGKLG